jgi:hypothetical protein
VAGLQGGILAVIGETQDLLGLRLEFILILPSFSGHLVCE